MDCGADEWGVTANDSIVVAVEVHLVGPTSGHRPAVGPTILKYCFNSVPIVMDSDILEYFYFSF